MGPESAEARDAAFTLGTAGHVDHGKTALVRALTGMDTDRLPEERRRGLSIVLGYASLRLTGGRRGSIVDVPGHERFIRTMVCGATGMDAALVCVAADDGVMPQTAEHAAVLRALGVDRGVVAITKADLADPAGASAAAMKLFPQMAVVSVSALTGRGLPDLRSALDAIAPRRGAAAGEEPLLHLDRVFSLPGLGTVVTGTLWSGRVSRGDTLRHLPAGQTIRVRSVQVHHAEVPSASAGQRVALALGRTARVTIAPGDVLTGPDSELRASYRLDVRCTSAMLGDEMRVTVHHGTRSGAARALALGDGAYQLRLSTPLLARHGDRVVLRARRATLGGAEVIDPDPPRHRATGPASGRAPAGSPEPAPIAGVGRAPERGSAATGDLPGAAASPGDSRPSLVRARFDLSRLPSLETISAEVEAIAARDGNVTVGALRDALGTNRATALELLRHFDDSRLTVRRRDDTRVLRRRAPRP